MQVNHRIDIATWNLLTLQIHTNFRHHSNLIWCTSTAVAAVASMSDNRMQFIQIISLCWVSAELLCRTDTRYIPTLLYQSSYLLCHCWTVAQCTVHTVLHAARLNSDMTDFTKIVEALGRERCEVVILKRSISFRLGESQFYYVDCRATIWYTSFIEIRLVLFPRCCRLRAGHMDHIYSCIQFADLPNT